MPNTWPIVSKEVTGKVLAQTPENENYVAVLKINELSQKWNDRQVSMIWNSSLGGSEKPRAIKGINKWHIKFNTVAYADTVINNLNK
jgi:hypothetical protein